MTVRLRREILLAGRRLVRAPALALPALAAVALGSGALAASYGAVDATLLRPLPYPEPHRLVMLWEAPLEDPEQTYVTSLPNVLDWRERAAGLERVAAFSVWFPAWTQGGEPTRRLLGALVTEDFFGALGVAPARGRVFSAEEHRPGAGRVVILSHRFWQGRLGGDPDVLGQSLELDGEPHRVIGVMPPRFRHPEPLYLEEATALWRPLARDPAALPRGRRFLRAVARLAPGTSPEAASESLTPVAAALEEEFPETNRGLGVTVVGLRRQLTGDVAEPLLLLLGAGVVVLLVAAGDLALLLAAAALDRSRYRAVAAALGARRRDLALPMLLEVGCLVGFGGVLGVLAGTAGARFLLATAPREIAGAVRFAADPRALAASLALCLVAALGAVLPPALRAAKPSPAAALSSGPPASGGRGGGPGALPGVLIVLQVALAFPLASSALLLARSLGELTATPTGMQPDGVATLRLELPSARYGDDQALRGAAASLLKRAGRIPGVQASGLTSSLPLSGLYDITREAEFEGAEDARPVGYRVISPAALEALGVPRLAGRGFRPDDVPGTRPVAVVNAALARSVWGDPRDALGERVTLGEGPPRHIVGVVGDVRHRSLSEPPRPEVFVPFGQEPVRFTTLVVRGTGALAKPLQRAVAAVDPGLPVDALGTLEEAVLRASAEARLRARLASGLAAVAVLLAGAGLFGAQAHATARRRRELAVRSSVGARPIRLAGDVLARGCLLAGAGIAPGALLAVAAGDALEGLLFGVAPLDVRSLVAAGGGLLAVAVLASVSPALSAAGAHPANALREE